MSLGYGCPGDNCDRPVAWILTHMDPPGTLSPCEEHYPVFAIGMLATELGVDAGRLYEAIRKHVDREAKAAAKAAADRYDEDHCPAVPDAVCYDPIQCKELGRCLKFNDDGSIRDDSPERVTP